MFTANIVPGQGFQKFTIWEQQNKLTETGRPISGGYINTDKTMYGILTEMSQGEIYRQKERGQFKQNTHPASHKIIEYGAMIKAQPTDCLISDNDGRKFYVRGMKNHGDLNVSVSYYVEERLDIK